MSVIIQMKRRTEPTALEAEAMALEVWHGPNPYASFLRKHDARPDVKQADTIGRLMGTRVRASDGRKYPAKPRAYPAHPAP